MKKNYIAPQTEAIELLADSVLMASPGAAFIPTSENIVSGEGGY